VDDERAILNSLRRLFEEADFDVYTAISGQEALVLLEENTVDVVLSDMRMPEMDGYTLLLEIRNKYPCILRTIISGYTEEKTMLKAILKGAATKYFVKPWSNEELLEQINQMLKTQEVLYSKRILNYLNPINELPTLRSSFATVINMIESESNIDDIVNEIGRDPAISTMLLHVANSAMYGVKTGSIKQAVIYLGLNNLKTLMYSMSIINTTNKSKEEKNYIESIWEHSMLTNKIMHAIYHNLLNRKVPEEGYSVGLVHNIGLVILVTYNFTECVICAQKIEYKGCHSSDIELEQFCVTHEEMGAYLIQWWNLPYVYVESALYHHHPESTSIINKELVNVVHIAQYAAWKILDNGITVELNKEALHKLNISEEELLSMLSSIS
jgi:HD-like signal output (HDOD) protein/CheY-like chemotaxis protein